MVSDFRHTHLLLGLRLIFIVAMAGLWNLFQAAFGSAAQQTLHHELEVEIFHDAKILRGIDTIHLPRGESRLRVAFHPGVRILAVGGAGVETVARTARKITHYGRYGRLSFKVGVNTGKGVGDVSESPLVVNLENDS